MRFCGKCHSMLSVENDRAESKLYLVCLQCQHKEEYPTTVPLFQNRMYIEERPTMSDEDKRKFRHMRHDPSIPRINVSYVASKRESERIRRQELRDEARRDQQSIVDRIVDVIMDTNNDEDSENCGKGDDDDESSGMDEEVVMRCKYCNSANVMMTHASGAHSHSVFQLMFHCANPPCESTWTLRTE